MIEDGMAKDILLKLVKAQTAEDVKKIIEDETFLKSVEWIPYGGKEYSNNFGLISALTSDPIKAVIEKIVNSIDALLIKACKEKGINPEDSKTAPLTMKRAAEIFFDIPNGDLLKLDDKKLRELANNIILFADGGTPPNKPNLTIADLGEGQHPDDFPNTFLSLLRKNKIKVPFVQGKFNMGGAAALTFCEYQLILSRVPKNLLNGKEDLWGFTIVRKNNDPSAKCPWYEYSVNNEDGKVFHFKGCPLNILPNGEKLEYGTFIKMYEFQLPDASIIVAGSQKSLWSESSRKMFAPVLPVLMKETRPYKMEKDSDYKYLTGNYIRINKDANPWKYRTIPITAELGEFGKKTIEVIIFKMKDDKGRDFPKNAFTTPEEAIFLTVNGQTHYTLSRHWLETKLQFSWLKDYMLVHIDLSDAGNKLNELFMANRENVKRTTTWKAFEERLIEELRRDPTLVKLNEEYRKSRVATTLIDDTKIRKILAKLIDANPQIAKILGIGLGIVLPKKVAPEIVDIPEASFPSSYYPTFLRIRDFKPTRNQKIFIKSLPVNSYVWIFLETDAPNDYTIREKDRGEWEFKKSDSVIIGGAKIENGIVPLRIYSTQKAQLYSSEYITIELTRPGHGDSLSVEFRVDFTPPIQKKINPPGKKRPKGVSYNLPRFIGVTKDQWNLYDSWTEETISEVRPSPGKMEILINMDSRPLHQYINQNPDVNQEKINNLYKNVIGLLTLSVYNIFEKEEERKKELVSSSMRGVAEIILPLIFNQDILSSM